MDHRTRDAVLYGELFGRNANRQVGKDLSATLRLLLRDSTLSRLAESTLVSNDDAQERRDVQVDDDLQILATNESDRRG